jgi:hypothetical protein
MPFRADFACRFFKSRSGALEFGDAGAEENDGSLATMCHVG